jgi:hypothetical protein
MDFNAILTAVVGYLGLGAAGTIIAFGIAVAADNVLGVLKAKLKDHNFAWKELGSFLESQFGTKKAAVVLVAVIAAVGSAVFAQVLAGAPEATLIQVAETVALSTAIAGSVAQFAAVAADVIDKAKALLA